MRELVSMKPKLTVRDQSDMMAKQSQEHDEASKLLARAWTSTKKDWKSTRNGPRNGALMSEKECKPVHDSGNRAETGRISGSSG